MSGFSYDSAMYPLALRFAIMCRTCMRCDTHKEPLQLHSIHGYTRINNLTDSRSIAQWLAGLVPTLKIGQEDGLPQRICPECLAKLLEFRQFQNLCLNADRTMRALHSEQSARPKDPLPTSEDEQVAEKRELVEDSDVVIESEIIKMEYEINACGKQPDETGLDTDVDRTAEEHYDENDLIVYEPKEEEDYDEAAAEPAYEGDSNSTDELEVSELQTPPPKRRMCRLSPCNICGRRFRDINRHKKVHDTEGRPFQCVHCNYRFATVVKLKSHATEWHSDTGGAASVHASIFSCDECQLLLPNADALATHKQDHQLKLNAKMLSCEECNKSCGSAAALSNHRRFHSGTRQHMMHNVSTPSEKHLYECQYCKKVYHQLSSLRDHVRTHTDEQPYLCSECGKAFNSLGNMKQHLLRHSGVMRYECPMCPRRFPCLSDLSSHKSQVHEEPKYLCKMCPGRFAKPYQLKKHMMYHTGDRPHKCDYCDKRFVCSEHMRRHRRTHTGERPYKCQHCERSFAQSNDLIKHLRSHVGDNVYKCELCPQSFRLASELRKHFAGHKHEGEVIDKDVPAQHIMWEPSKYSMEGDNNNADNEQEQSTNPSQ